MTEQEKQEIIEAIKANSTDINTLIEAATLDGILSLPGIRDGQELVSVPIELLADPAIQAAIRADAKTAEMRLALDAAQRAIADANSAAANATTKATEAETKANAATNNANTAADRANRAALDYEETALTALSGATMRFAAFVEIGKIEAMGTPEPGGEVVYVKSAQNFAYRIGSTFYGSWRVEGIGNEYDFIDSDTMRPYSNKTYLYEDSMFIWDETKQDLVEVSGSGSGSGFYNVTNVQPLSTGYYTKETAIAALANEDIDDKSKPGMIITFKQSDGKWVDYRFAATDISSFLVPASWEEYGSGKIKSITVNGTPVNPNPNGTAEIVFDQITVDESLDDTSSNAVQNAAVSRRLNEVDKATIGGVEVIESEGKNTLNIMNKQGGVIASTEFSGGGGGGGGSSTASRIVLTAQIDKPQVKEGGNATLTYSYNHVNADGLGDGVKADITVTVSRGATETFKQIYKNVSAGTFTLDLTDYMLAGVMDVYVKATAVTAEGTTQTKQAYASISVITLKLTSSYNLASTIENGGYSDGDTIEIPFTLTGSGNKVVSMYLDSPSAPVTQTIGKSGTVNGSFNINASSLQPGSHAVQLVAERDGILSDSIYINIFKKGRYTSFIGVKYTDKDGIILSSDYKVPKINVGQYETMSFEYVAYDESVTPALLTISKNGSVTNTINVPRTMQMYSNRFTEKGFQLLTLNLKNADCRIEVNVKGSSINLNEAKFGLIAKFDAAGRNNGESNPGVWESNGIKTHFENFNWESNGWIDNSLVLTNGARATIDYMPFDNDVKAKGLTLEITMKVTNSATRSDSVISCIDNGKGLLITGEEASFLTGEKVIYTNEDNEVVEREIRLGTNYVQDTWIKVALVINTAADDRLMHLYINGNRTGADVYDKGFNFKQDNPKKIIIDSTSSDVYIRSIRIYDRALTDDEELENNIVDSETSDKMISLYDDNNILGDTGGVDLDKIRAKGKNVLRIVRPNKLDDVYAENNKKTDFQSNVYFYSAYGKEYDFVLENCNIRIQGTSSTKYPSKNIRIYFSKGTAELSFSINGVPDPYGGNKYKMRPDSIPMNLFCFKSDYSDSSMSLNTGGAKLFNDILKELGLLTPPQRFQYEQGGKNLNAISIRTAIDGMPCDIFCSETLDGESEYYGQYNFNNEKSKSQNLFGMVGVEGFNPVMPMTFETLNNTADMCLFKTQSDEQIPQIFDAGLESNYPDDVKWVGLTTEQQNAILRLYGWIRSCVPHGASSENISSFKNPKFAKEIDQYFDKDEILTYYLWTDYFLAVDQRAKNMMLRTWDGMKWYLTYYDGDTQLGKRNDCFLVYNYMTDRDTYDAEASKYAFEGRESWLWNLVLANLQDDLKRCAANLRAVMTNERVLKMLNIEQSGNWADRAFNKSGEMKYILPAINVMYGKTWPFIYALQGSNQAHREYVIRNRFALLDAKYGTSNFTSDNIDLYMSRTTSDVSDNVKITANEVYAFGYGTNNSPNLANSGIIKEGEIATLSIKGAYTVNDPLRIYGASRIRVLDMTGAADHLKNGLDLGKCSVLRELNLQSSSTGSTGWWLNIDNCKQLRKINVRNQKFVKTGSSTSTELDLSNQTKLLYVDAYGTNVRAVNIAKGAPVTTVYLPATLETLRLEYLSELQSNGLIVQDYSNVKTFIFSDCRHLNWQTLLSKCVNVERIRVTGIDIDGDERLLEKYMTKGGIDVNGNVTETCALCGNYRLTKYIEEEKYQAYKAHYPELNIEQPKYTMIEFDESVSDDANISNLDNGTGCKFNNAYVPSGHIIAILNKRHRVLAKVTKMPTSKPVTMAGVQTTINNLDGSILFYPLHDSNSNFYADASDVKNCTPAKLDGSEGDWMMLEPEYWSKGINDYLGNKLYACFSSNKAMPDRPVCTVLNKEDLEVKKNKKIMANRPTLTESYSTDSSYSVCKVNVQGFKRVRFPSVPGTNLIGSVFVDAQENVVKDIVVPTISNRFEAGMYLISDVPSKAVALYFTIKNSAEFDKVVLSNSNKIEDMEPDWVHNDECLCAVCGSSVLNSKLRACITGGSTTANMAWSDFHYYSVQRGMQQIDPLIHSHIANMFYAKYGRRDSQMQCGAGSNTNSRKTGGTSILGMQDTVNTDGNVVGGVESDGLAFYKTVDSDGNVKFERISNTNCLGYEDIYGNKSEMMDRVDMPNDSGHLYKWRIWMPDDTIRWVKAAGANTWIVSVAFGKYMDNIPVGMMNGSSSTHYCDYYYISGSADRVVLRGYSNASALGGVSYASANLDASHTVAHCGSRLAFRGKIVKAQSVEIFKAASEVA